MKATNGISRFSVVLSSSLVQTTCQIIMGGIFVYASLDKIIHPLDFASILRNYRLLPSGLIIPVAIILPWTELFLGSLLIFGFFPKKAAIGLSLLLMIFVLAILINLVRGLDFNCGCFSTSPGSSRYKGIIWIARDILIFGLGAIIIFINKKEDDNPLVS